MIHFSFDLSDIAPGSSSATITLTITPLAGKTFEMPLLISSRNIYWHSTQTAAEGHF